MNYQKISKISKKAVSINENLDYLTLQMDIEFCVMNNLVDLDKLESFDDFNFMHDIIGITKNLNRTTGEMKNCFLPRSTPKFSEENKVDKSEEKFICQRCSGEIFFYVEVQYKEFNKKTLVDSINKEDFLNLHMPGDFPDDQVLNIDYGTCSCPYEKNDNVPLISFEDYELLCMVWDEYNIEIAGFKVEGKNEEKKS